MLMSKQVERFWDAVPRPFVERVFRSIIDNYKIANERCEDFDEKIERSNLVPFYRRALIERSLRAIAMTFPDDMIAESVQFESKGFWFHTRIICNGDVALTQSTTPNPEIIVRNSCFRNCYASNHNQGYLFPDLAPEKLPENPLLYGIIIHGRAAGNRLVPGFAQIRFPKPGLDSYYESIIDLFGEFPEVVKEKMAICENIVPESNDENEVEPELLDSIEMTLNDDINYGKFGT